MATSQLQGCKYKIIPSIISCLFCSIMNYSLIPMFIKLTTNTHRHPGHTHSHTHIYIFYSGCCISFIRPFYPLKQKSRLRARSRLTAHYQVLPSIVSGRTNTTTSSSHPLFSQSHPCKDRQKSFICSLRLERRGEERRLCFDRRDKGAGRTKTSLPPPFFTS